MERPSSTRGSPSEQLTAFNPIGYGAFAHRENPVPFPGMGTIRPIGDPFASWSNDLLSAPTVASQTTPTSSASGHAYAPQAFEHSNALAQIAPATLDATLNQANTHVSGNQFEYSSTSPQLSPTNAGSGGMRYSPSHVQSSRSVDQTQYSPHASTRNRVHLGDPHYLLSPVQTAIANTRYSPSREEISYEYSPTPAFISSLFATTHGPATGDVIAAPANALTYGNADHQAGRNTGITASRSFSGGIHDVTEKQRSFIVHNVPLDTSHRSIIMMFPIEEYSSLEYVCLKQLGTKGVFSFSFGDLREAINAMNKIRSTRPGWRVFPSTAREIASLNGTNGPSASAPSDGAFLLSVFTTQWLMEPMDRVVEDVVASLGKLRSCKLIENGTNMSRYHVEYFNVRHAAYAFSCLGGFRLDSLHFGVSPINAKEEPTLSRNQTPSRVSPRSPVTPYHLVSKENETEEKIDISPASEEGKTNPEHAIDLDRIRHGLDVRSTVMVRNIPNKLSSEQLQRIIDESSYGKYDFLYLRMDFTHRCNVGYAFMNFGDPIDILDLVRARQGKTWPNCISEKRAEVSYATLQGKDALISKFRNSNVMTRPHEERPRLFHIDGPRAGTEMAFPGPNDASKLRRSVASTTQQGLFAPRTRGPTTPRTNRTRPHSQSFSQTPRGRGFVRTPRHSAGRSVQHAPGEFASTQAENRQFTSQRN
ncbi:RNA recognition motif 2 [Penicillium fimorum]|uniref:RNA recognition motif 2 n=1 Tax=Penicillium fimorum TaxID=1882269 RepID=A0A9W9XWI2_9EURO|nr:RNA recognition motif 2 [Penicillium fimorum]